MYEDFQLYMSDFLDESCSQDYWYDIACDTACEILEEFSECDWNEMKEKLNNQPIEFKRKLAYCLGNDMDTLFELDILLMLIDTDDKELFETTVSSLRGFLPNFKNKILEKTEIENRINSMIADCSKVSKLVYLDFLEKLHME